MCEVYIALLALVLFQMCICNHYYYSPSAWAGNAWLPQLTPPWEPYSSHDSWWFNDTLCVTWSGCEVSLPSWCQAQYQHNAAPYRYQSSSILIRFSHIFYLHVNCSSLYTDILLNMLVPTGNQHLMKFLKIFTGLLYFLLVDVSWCFFSKMWNNSYFDNWNLSWSKTNSKIMLTLYNSFFL